MISLRIEKADNIKVNITEIVWDFNCLGLGVWTLYSLCSGYNVIVSPGILIRGMLHTN